MLTCVVLPPGVPDATERLLAVSPLVERDGDVVFLDVRGTSRLHGGTAGVFTAVRRALRPHAPRHLAMASNRFTAEVAARYSRSAVAVAPGEEALFLSRLPLAALPMPDALAQRIEPLGLETLGDFASLPVSAVERRYGQQGVALHRLARGQDDAGLLPERPDARPIVVQELDESCGSLQRLQPTLEELIERLVSLLEQKGRGAARLRLTLRLDQPRDLEVSDEALAAPAHEVRYDISPASPELRAPLLLDLVLLRLQAAPPVRPVSAVHLEVLESQALDVHQNTLFGEVSRDASRQAEALSRLATVLGEHSVSQPRLQPAHRLEERWDEQRPGPRPRRAVIAERPVSTPTLRLLESPEELVPIHAGRTLVGFRRGRRELRARHLSPPRRLEGGWWHEPWARDEFDLETDDGALYRICRDMRSRRWLLMGEVD